MKHVSASSDWRRQLYVYNLYIITVAYFFYSGEFKLTPHIHSKHILKCLNLNALFKMSKLLRAFYQFVAPKCKKR